MKIVFLDRDGVINEFPGHGDYVTTFKQFRFIKGSLQAISKLTDAGFKVIVISNQACVGKGLLSKEKLQRITERLIDGVNKYGGKIDGIYYCAHRSDDGCECRKPGIGNIKLAVRHLGENLSSIKGSYFIGDAKSDCLAAYAAGLKSIAVLTGKETLKDIKSWDKKPHFIVDNLAKAVDLVLGAKHSKANGQT